MAAVRDAIDEYINDNPCMHLTLSVADIEGLEGGFVIEVAGRLTSSRRYLARSLTAIIRLGGIHLVLDFRHVDDFAEAWWDFCVLDDLSRFHNGSLPMVYDLIRFHNGSLSICAPRDTDTGVLFQEPYRGITVYGEIETAIASLRDQYDDPRRTQDHLEVAARIEDLPGLQAVARRAAGRPEVFCLSLLGTVTNDHIIPLIKSLWTVSESGFSLIVLDLARARDRTDAALLVDLHTVTMSKARNFYDNKLVLTHVQHAESLCLHLIPRMSAIDGGMFYICDETVSLDWIPSTKSFRAFDFVDDSEQISENETVGIRFNEADSTIERVGLPQQRCSHCELPIHRSPPGCRRCDRCGHPLLVGLNRNIGRFATSHSWPSDALDRFFNDPL